MPSTGCRLRTVLGVVPALLLPSLGAAEDLTLWYRQPAENYGPAEVTNLSECHEPFFPFVEELVSPGRRGAREVYGAAGFVDPGRQFTPETTHAHVRYDGKPVRIATVAGGEYRLGPGLERR